MKNPKHEKQKMKNEGKKKRRKEEKDTIVKQKLK